ncbi:hypothetical protein [Cellulosimicrobium marinum]|uniref:hypothetical protein n=1 Tax=Cellulosimicrobium marinum TaxID=1638992 RepID=UPI001E37671D|nr:hypothetical protein [Cellulosimicrobium marinum]MCB7135150.1 hypothetical protein [Cellulosimicrobium marinum]
MSDPGAHHAPDHAPTRLPLPRVGTFLLVVGAVLLVFGGFVFLATADRETDVKAVGYAMHLAGVAMLVGGLVVVGVRAVAQRHLEVLAALRSQR